MAETSVTMTVYGIENAKRALASLEHKARRRVVSAGVRAGNKVLRDTARSLAPSRTGTLRKSINSSIKLDRATGIVRGTIYAGKATKAMQKKKQTAYYAHMVHGGTKPHEISVPKRKGMTVGGAVVQRVMHPGSRPNPWMERAAQTAFQRAVEAFRKAFGDKLRAEIGKP